MTDNATITDWMHMPWEFCDECGDLLVIHWRGRPCLQVLPADSNGLEITLTS